MTYDIQLASFTASALLCATLRHWNIEKQGALLGRSKGSQTIKLWRGISWSSSISSRQHHSARSPRSNCRYMHDHPSWQHNDATRSYDSESILARKLTCRPQTCPPACTRQFLLPVQEQYRSSSSKGNRQTSEFDQTCTNPISRSMP